MPGQDQRTGWDVYIKGGSINYEKDVLEWALEAERLGAGETF